MRDTGLACYLAKIPDANILESSYLKGPMVETFIINEIMKTHSNRGLETPFFHFRASERTEIDLLMLYDGKINMIECKSGITISPSDASAFGRLATTLGKGGCVVCSADNPYPISEGIYALPVWTIGC